MPKRPSLQPVEFRIGWLCALQIEVDAARAVLDEEYDDFQEAAHCILGRVGGHNVVVACPPAGQIGSGAAAVTAERLKSMFPQIQYYLMVGVGAGVPSSTSDIRLGDIIISQPQGNTRGVVQYDMGKRISGGQNLRTGSLNDPPSELLSAITKLRSNMTIGRSGIATSLQLLTTRRTFARPTSGSDVLFEATYEHVNGHKCTHCSKDRIVHRNKRQSDQPVVYCGPIASGNQVIRDGVARDELSQQLGGVLCFEMEAAGLMNNFPCLVIRGVCDYADSHKNKEWQPFAAAAAAACSKEILSCLPSRSRSFYWLPDSPRVNSTATSPNPDTVSLRNVGSNLFTKTSQNDKVSNTYLTLASTCLSEIERQQYFKSLRFHQLETRYLSVKTPHPETCEWLLERLEFENWLSTNSMKQNYGLLWIKGKAATGKSTMVKFLWSHIKRNNSTAVVTAFFFNARGATIERSALGMYRSILYQLIQQRPHLQGIFDTSLVNLEKDGSVSWDIDSLQTLLRLAVHHLDKDALFCFIDALDECDDNEVIGMVKFFENLGKSAFASHTEVRTLFSSRHYPHIDVERGIQMILEDQTEHDEDIIKYICNELRVGGNENAQRLMRTILEKSSGIFLWVVLVVETLNREYRRGRIGEMETRLEDLPDDFQKLFDDILGRAGDWPAETFLCLQWALHSERPLSVEELYSAIMFGLEAKKITTRSSVEVTKEDMERYILDSSRGMLEQTRGEPRTVQFIHESVRQYILGRQIFGQPPFLSADIFAARSHDLLKLYCQKYYQQASVEINALPNEIYRSAPLGARLHFGLYSTVKLEETKRFPFLSYAIHSVFHHSNAAARFGLSQEDFLSEHNKRDWTSAYDTFHQIRDCHLLGCNTYLNPIMASMPGRSVLYYFANQGLIYLTRVELGRPSALNGLLGEDHWLVLTGLADSSNYSTITMVKWLSGVAPDQLLAAQIPKACISSDAGIQRAMELLQKDGKGFSQHDSYNALAWAARTGLRTLVKLYLAHNTPASLRNKDTGNHLFLAIMEAAFMENIEILQMLIDAGDLSRKEEAELFYTAAWHGRVRSVRTLLECLDPEPHVLSPALIWACQSENSQIFDLLSKIAGVFDSTAINHPDKDGNTYLSVATAHNAAVIVRNILRFTRIDVNIANREGDTPLAFAISHGHITIAKYLLSHPNIDVNAANHQSLTPLILAITKRKLDIIRTLLDHVDIDVNMPDKQGLTPLLYAIHSSNEEIVKLLITHVSININLQGGGDYTTPLFKAIDMGNVVIVKLILDHHDLIISHALHSILLALLYSENDALELQTIRNEVEACAEKQNGTLRRILFMSIHSDNARVLQFLLSCEGVDVNMLNQYDETPLQVATRSNKPRCVRSLLQKSDIVVDSADQEEMNPLNHATEMGYLEIVEALLQHPDTDVNMPSGLLDMTPLSLAVQQKHVSMVEVLLTRSDIDLNKSDHRDGKPLYLAIELESPQIVRLLLNHADRHSKVFEGVSLQQMVLLREYIATNETSLKSIRQRFPHGAIVDGSN